MDVNTTLKEIKEFFDKHNISIDLCYESHDGKLINPHLEMTFEDSYDQTVYLDHFWEGRIKAYNLVPKIGITE